MPKYLKSIIAIIITIIIAPIILFSACITNNEVLAINLGYILFILVPLLILTFILIAIKDLVVEKKSRKIKKDKK